MRSRRRPSIRPPLAAAGLLLVAFALVAPARAEAQFAEPPPPREVPLSPDPGPEIVLRPPRPYAPRRPSVSLWQPTVSLELASQLGAGRDLVGLELSAGALAAGRLFFELRLAALFDTSRHPAGEPVLSQAEDRVQVGGEVGYRLRLGEGRLPVYLVPRFGMAAALDVSKTRRGLLAEDGRLFTHDERRYRWSALPVFGAGLLLGNLEVTYRYQLDAQDRRRSTHGLSLGFRF
jgi:hypothetical protein